MKSAIKFLNLGGLVFVTGLMMILSSCSKEDDAATPTLGNSKVLLINSASTSSAINFYWTGNKLNKVPLTFGNTTGYQTVTAGIRDIQIKANTSNQLLATSSIKLATDSSYTFFVYNDNNTIKTAVAEDDMSIPSLGNAKFKFANMSFGLSSADLAISNGPVISSSISFGAIGNYVELKAGTYNLVLRVHGSNKVIYNIPNVRFDNGKIYTIWSGGNVNSGGPDNLSAQTIIQ